MLNTNFDRYTPGFGIFLRTFLICIFRIITVTRSCSLRSYFFRSFWSLGYFFVLQFRNWTGPCSGVNYKLHNIEVKKNWLIQNHKIQRLLLATRLILTTTITLTQFTEFSELIKIGLLIMRNEICCGHHPLIPLHNCVAWVPEN